MTTNNKFWILKILSDYRLILNGKYFFTNNSYQSNYENFSFDQEKLSKNNKSQGNSNDYIVSKKVFSENINMMH